MNWSEGLTEYIHRQSTVKSAFLPRSLGNTPGSISSITSSGGVSGITSIGSSGARAVSGITRAITRISGTRISGTRVGGTRIGGTRVGGTRISGTRVGGTRVGGRGTTSGPRAGTWFWSGDSVVNGIPSTE